MKKVKSHISFITVCMVLTALFLPFSVFAEEETVSSIEFDLSGRQNASTDGTVEESGTEWSFTKDTSGSLLCSVTNAAEGLYKVYVTGKTSKSDAAWSVRSFSVKGSEGSSDYKTYIVGGSNNIFAANNTDYEEHYFGTAQLPSGASTVKISLWNHSTSGHSSLKKIRLVPVSDEMIDENGELTVAVNRLSVSDTAKFGEAADDYLTFKKQSNSENNSTVSFDVYTQKPGKYMLSGVVKGREIEGYPFYWENCKVGETSVLGDLAASTKTTTDYPLATDAVDTAPKESEIKVIWLAQGKNTITIGMQSGRNASMADLYAVKLKKYIPAFNMENGSVTVATTPNNAVETVNQNGGAWADDILVRMRANSSGHYATFVVTGAEAGTYSLSLEMATYTAGTDGYDNFIITTEVNGVSYEKSFRFKDYTVVGYPADSKYILKLDNIVLNEGTNQIVFGAKGSNSAAHLDMYSFSLVKYVPFIESVTLEGCTATVNLNANPTNVEEVTSLNLFVAIYDGDNNLIAVDAASRNGESEETTLTARAETSENAARVCAYLWTEEMCPVWRVLSNEIGSLAE